MLKVDCVLSIVEKCLIFVMYKYGKTCSFEDETRKTVRVTHTFVSYSARKSS